MLLSVKVWATAHLLVNGGLHDLLLFGGFLIWAVPDFIRLRRRDRANGTVYATRGPARDALVLGLGVLAYALLTLLGEDLSDRARLWLLETPHGDGHPQEAGGTWR